MGFNHPHYNLPIQITPQQAYLKIKPGESLQVTFTYRHMRPASGVEVQDFALQTSDLNAIGLDISFDIECHGNHVNGKVCQGIREGDEIKFTATVTLKECKSGGDVAASIGVYGYNMVSAIFVTPLCACECEKVKNLGPYDRKCNAAGRLICGQCACERGFGGSKCQCDLAKYGASSAEELDNRCRRSPDEPVCSGKGTCECGTCKCKANFIQGQFCECDSTSCPKDSEGRLCSGRGECECGTCQCEHGFEGDDCGCTSNSDACRENGQICSNNGKCICGRCACRDGFTGAFCSVERASNEKDGSTLNAGEFDEDPEGDILPTQDERDQGVDAGKAEGQESEASAVQFPMQTVLGVLTALLTIRIGLLLA